VPGDDRSAQELAHGLDAGVPDRAEAELVAGDLAEPVDVHRVQLAPGRDVPHTVAGVEDARTGLLFGLHHGAEGGDRGGEVRHRGEVDQGDRAEVCGRGEERALGVEEGVERGVGAGDVAGVDGLQRGEGTAGVEPCARLGQVVLGAGCCFATFLACEDAGDARCCVLVGEGEGDVLRQDGEDVLGWGVEVGECGGVLHRGGEVGVRGAEGEDGAGERWAGDGEAAGEELVLRRCGGVLDGGAVVADLGGHLGQGVEAVTECSVDHWCLYGSWSLDCPKTQVRLRGAKRPRQLTI
jgi:hypothetical protein